MTETLEKHFVIDSMLGKLAKWLRILGFDARYEQLKNQEQIEAYRRQGLLLITRNRKWSGQSGILCLTADDLTGQLQEVVLQVPIAPQEIRLLERCIRCNDKLGEIDREDALGQVPDYVFETHTSFHQCPTCQRIYWSGSHPMRVVQRLQRQLGWPIST
jgi:uncharacterized protein